MSDMFEVLSLLAAPAAILLSLRWYVIRQNRVAEARERQPDTAPS